MSTKLSVEFFPEPKWRDYFPGKHMRAASRVEWESQKSGSTGQFWIAIEPSGQLWCADGQESIAVISPDRVMRFLRAGIAYRQNVLLQRYLQGDLIPISQGDTVINFGANIGEVALGLAKRGARIFAIEPDPHVLPALYANALGKLITVSPTAAWDKDGTVDLYLKTETADTSAFNPSEVTIIANAKRIDTLAKEQRLEHVRLIVGDAEGAEPEVLDGARETLAITDYVSICASAERRGERTTQACAAILQEAGFEIIHQEMTGFGILIGKNANVQA